MAFIRRVFFGCLQKWPLVSAGADVKPAHSIYPNAFQRGHRHGRGASSGSQVAQVTEVLELSPPWPLPSCQVTTKPPSVSNYRPGVNTLAAKNLRKTGEQSTV